MMPSIASASDGHGLGPDVWITIAGMLFAAKIGGFVAGKLKQPPVLGELLVGVVVGNLGLIGADKIGLDFAHIAELPSIMFLAELGVVLLLFEVGLESTLSDMKRVAPQSGLVAIIGVIAPMLLGYGGSKLMQPDASTSVHLFVGATLCATSVGITARVLKDIGALARPETSIILGAAVIDDVLGLIVLAIVSGIAASGVFPDALALSKIVGLSFGFLLGALLLGAFVMPGVFRVSSRMKTDGVLAALTIGFCLLLSGISAAMGLAAIVGAFAAGLILDEVHVRPFGKEKAEDLNEYVAPLVKVIAPIFFVRTGMMVQLSAINPKLLMLALVLSIAAVVGKVVCGLGVRGGKGTDKLTVGIGMIPRGEVGLIFATQGAQIVVNGERVINAEVYAAVVLMVMLTTVVTPPWLASRIAKVARRTSESGKSQGAAKKHGTPARAHGTS